MWCIQSQNYDSEDKTALDNFIEIFVGQFDKKESQNTKAHRKHRQSLS